MMTAQTTFPAQLAAPRHRDRPLETPIHWAPLAAFVGMHVPLALAMKTVPMASTAHCLAAFLIGLGVVLRSSRWIHAALVIAYIVGAEVLWRMSNAQVFWEYGKYAVILLWIPSFFRDRQLGRNLIPVLLFLLLLPAVPPAFLTYDWHEARQMISFNLSGPLCLAVCTVAMNQRRISNSQMVRLFVCLLAPIVGVVTLILFRMSSTTAYFGSHSNFYTSGGYGPNQVSAILGLAAVICFFCALNLKLPRLVRLAFAGAMLWFLSQSVLTFSRSGFYYSAASLLIAGLFLAGNRRARVQLLVGGGAMILIASLVIFPRLDSFTGGTLSARFSDTNSTNRDKIALADLQIALEHPLFGIGVGMAEQERIRFFGRSVAAHTEYSRLLAEHGIMGLAALTLMLGLVIRKVFTTGNLTSRALSASLVTFVALFMAGSGMRLALPAFLIGLSLTSAVANPSPSPAPARARRFFTKRQHFLTLSPEFANSFMVARTEAPGRKTR